MPSFATKMNPSFSSARLLATALFASSAVALDWWVDSSCETKLPGGVDIMLGEAVDTAQAITQRLEDGDENMIFGVKDIMKFDHVNPGQDQASKDYFESTSPLRTSVAIHLLTDLMQES